MVVDMEQLEHMVQVVAGGGGGYYGGGGGVTSAYCVGGSAGGGGSSFISGYTGCNAINSSGTVTGQPNHYSGYVFSNGYMEAGVQSGDGVVKITRIS
jgi:hypothetical protein